MRFSPLLLVLPLLATACGGSSDPDTLIDEGETALNSGDDRAAIQKFEAALDLVEPQSSQYVQAKLGVVKAAAKSAPAKAREEFLELAKAHPDQIGENQYYSMAQRLGDAGEEGLRQATQLLQVALEAFPESPAFSKLLTDLGKKAEATGSAGALDALKGLGYVGD